MLAKEDKPDARVEAAQHSSDDDLRSSSSQNRPDTSDQAGIQSIEATTLAWTTKSLVGAYIIIWFTYFVEGMLGGTIAALNPFVTSAWASHSLTPTVLVLSSVIGGVTNLTLAKILDVFGRPQGYLFCTVLATMGLIMMAACNSVESYAAAQVFQTVGNNGIQYSLSVLIADTSSLKNRGLMQALMSSPNLITCWLAGPIAKGFLGPIPDPTTQRWRWAFGMFTIMVPCVALPLYALLLKNWLKAKKLGLITKQDSGRSALQSFIHYCHEFDAVGLLLLSAGVALFLLPFNLYTLQAEGWTSPLVLSMLIIGFFLIVGFAVWEKFFAQITFIPYSLLLDRTVAGACMLAATLFMSYSLWSGFFSSFLQVVYDLDVDKASYVVQTYTVASVLVAIAVGGWIHYSGHFKLVCLIVGIPLNILGLGLFIYFRNAGSGIGYMVMCQIFISVASGAVIICDEIAILSAASHKHVAVCIAVLGVFSNIGGAIGFTLSSAIWQNIFPDRLAQYLPADALQQLLEIYTSIDVQLSFPAGTPERDAIQRAYSDGFLYLLITATAIWVIGVVGVLMWRNINVKTVKQTKGHVW